MIIKQFEYGIIETRRIQTGEKEYTFTKTQSRGYSLLEILQDIGGWGWQFIGDIEGKLIAMKEVERG